MELFLIILAFWLYHVYKKSDEATKQRYKEKVREAYNRILIETQKARQNSKQSVDWYKPVEETKDTPTSSWEAPKPLYTAQQNDMSDGPVVKRQKSFWGPSFED